MAVYELNYEAVTTQVGCTASRLFFLVLGILTLFFYIFFHL